MSETYPATDELAQGLAAVLAANGDLSIERREPNRYASTFASEIVTCRVGAGRVELLCKYGPAGEDNTRANRHRGGVPYEASVYERCLSRAGCSTPAYHGRFDLPRAGQCCLVVQYLAGAQPAGKMVHRCPLSQVATWIGRFHAMHTGQLDERCYAFLCRYDASYYRFWAERAAMQASDHRDARWLAELCTAFADRAMELLGGDETLIHGEFYPSNVLVQDETVYPVDWESAAIGAGVIDLAALTEDWSVEEVRACRDAYVAARFAGKAPGDFDRRLDAGRLYLHLRWLGGRVDWKRRARARRSRLDAVRRISDRLGIMRV